MCIVKTEHFYSSQRLKSKRDFLKAPALESVQGHLNRMYKDVKKELKKSK